MREGMERVIGYGLCVLVAIAATGVHLAASNLAPVPEVDASAIPVGFGLLAAGVLMLRARRQTK